MKNFDDLQSIWEDFSAKPYIHDEKTEITLMTRGDDSLVIQISDRNDEENGESIYLENINITPQLDNNFKISFINKEDYSHDFLVGEHPIKENDNIMILDIPKYGKRYFEKKSGHNFRYKPVNLD